MSRTKKQKKTSAKKLGLKMKWVKEGNFPVEVVQATLHNAYVILYRHPLYANRIWFNEFDNNIYITIDGKETALEDYHLYGIVIKLTELYDVNFSSGVIYEATQMVARLNKRDPLRDYIEALQLTPEQKKNPILDTWLIRFFGVEDSPLHRAYSRKFAIGALARALYSTVETPIKQDCTLILYAAQGKKKSTAIKELSLFTKWFSDIPFDMGSNKEACLKIAGKFLYELKELAKRRAKDKEIEKAFLDTMIDRYRPPYGKVTISRPRRTSFIGTTNRLDILQDSSGSRRFWPVVCCDGWDKDRTIDVEGIKKHALQIWAEALAAYKAGDSWWLDTKEEEARVKEAQHFASYHPWKDEIKSYLARTNQQDITPKGVMNHLDLPRNLQTKSNLTTIEMIMQELGYLRRRIKINGKKVTKWRKE